MSLLYIILAILGLSFLVFIHELGHYWMARRVGMRVETFSVGFGKPLYSWKHDGVKWQIGWLPFGGFVKIAGTETDNGKDPYKIKNGFFGKTPWERIKVALAGPLANLLFALLVFTFLWVSGGREKEFSELTKKLGWIDTKSELFEKGIRPGDEVTAYDGHPVKSTKDHLFAPILGDEVIEVKGNKVDPVTGDRELFEMDVNTYTHPRAVEGDIPTLGVIASARYIIYDKLPGGKENPLPNGSPMKTAGLEYGDRILWVDGELIYSETQLSELINDDRILLTIQRGNETKLARVPRVQVKEFHPDSEFRDELIDWQFEAGLNGRRGTELFAIPYNLSSESVVEGDLRFIDEEKAAEVFPIHPYSEVEERLHPGDRILAVQGVPVTHSSEILAELQDKKHHIIVQRSQEALPKLSWTDADEAFHQGVDFLSLGAIAKNIGKESQINARGELQLLGPVAAIPLKDFSLPKEHQEAVKLLREKIEAIEDPELRSREMKNFDRAQERLLLGIPVIQDRKVNFNPEPLTLFSNISSEMGRTLQSLFSGGLSPKFLSGPVGIVQIVHQSTMLGFKEALFWLGLISVNLGFLNLLPIPVLDGGTIVFSLYEMVSGKKIKPKTMEKFILPFALLLIGFFVFITFNDISRVIERVF